jgi:hypothetical protein
MLPESFQENSPPNWTHDNLIVGPKGKVILQQNKEEREMNLKIERSVSFYTFQEIAWGGLKPALVESIELFGDIDGKKLTVFAKICHAGFGKTKFSGTFDGQNLLGWEAEQILYKYRWSAQSETDEKIFEEKFRVEEKAFNDFCDKEHERYVASERQSQVMRAAKKLNEEKERFGEDGETESRKNGFLKNIL